VGSQYIPVGQVDPDIDQQRRPNMYRVLIREQNDQAHTVCMMVDLCQLLLYQVRKRRMLIVQLGVVMNRLSMVCILSVQLDSGKIQVRKLSTDAVRVRIELSRCHMQYMMTDRWRVDMSQLRMVDM
jgi:hypothetical protein